MLNLLVNYYVYFSEYEYISYSETFDAAIVVLRKIYEKLAK